MQKTVRKTGDFGVGLMIHTVHMTDDVAALNRFYEEVFGGLIYFGVDEPHYLPIEDRFASLVQIGDLCIETMAPRMPADPGKPVGRFYTKYGRHLHSVGYQVDDLAGLGNHLIGEGVYIGAPGGGRLARVEPGTQYFFPSPRDLNGLMVELCGMDMPGDPRLLDTWSSQIKMWEHGHPLTLRRLAHVTIGVGDADRAAAHYAKVFQATQVDEGVDEDLGIRFHVLPVGDSLLRLAEPIDGSSELGRHVARWGDMIYSHTLQVRDLDRAQAWLREHGIRTARPRPTLLVADPADTFGAPYHFTTEPVPGDPFDAEEN